MGSDPAVLPNPSFYKITTVLDFIQANDVEFLKLILLGASLLKLSK